MLQLRGHLDFVEEFLVTRVLILLGYLECHPALLDRIVGTVNVGQRTGGDATENPVFSDFLSGSQQVWLRFRWREAAVRICSAIIGASAGAVKGNIIVTRR
jgi:glycerol uptake facilitator-like aquaporin